jgi:NADH-quinone oxidoreductase subunit L
VLDQLAWLVPLSPLVGAIICIVLAFRGDRQWAQWPAVVSLAISAVVALMLLFSSRDESGMTIVDGYTWLSIGSVRIEVSLRLDNLALSLLAVVTTVSCLVAIYARDYMRDDPGYARFFAAFTGFVFCMTMLVLANNLLVLYAFWEGVGTCSYLLIGYYYQRPSAAKAAIKAFLVNRVADCAFLLGILLLGYVVGQTSAGQHASGLGRLDFAVILDAAQEIAASQTYPALIGWIALLFVLGAIGKSAQFPFHVWLPDAMEGPTPVSALIHAATMVTAGVYLMARLAPLMVFAPHVLILLGWLGGITCLAAAVMAFFQDDLKRVLAYSTASQLGYLFMALSCGTNRELMTMAVAAAMFHLVTHAFFKALLFLSAGNVMHAMGDVIDMRRFRGLKVHLPKTNIFFAIGGLALAGFPLLSAYFSKDAILGLLNEARVEPEYRAHYTCFLGIGFLTAFLTAIYTSKAYCRTFTGAVLLPPEAGHHPHEASKLMLAPLYVLAVGAVIAGGLLGPTSWMLDYIAGTPLLPELHGSHHEPWWLLISSGVLAIVGILIGRQLGTAPWPTTAPANPLAEFGRNRLYIDALYQATIVAPLLWLSHAVSGFDRTVVDGLTVGVARLPAGIGLMLRPLQTGMVPSYASFTALGMVALAVWMMWR